MLQSKAAEFYRLYLINPTKLTLDDAPSYENGTKNQAPEVALKDMSPNEIIE